MSLQACADIVRRGDPDRFAAAMAAPVAARRVLFPLYAFNLEVARAPWVASEPMIGDMRLQWWRDALEEIGSGGPVRRHEVTTPLAEVLDRGTAEVLDRLVAARRWDLYREPFEDAAHFRSYLGDTGGILMWTAARLLGAEVKAVSVVTGFGYAAGLARFLRAVPELETRGRIPLVDGRPEAVSALAGEALDGLRSPGDLRRALPGLARAALIEGWEAVPILEQAKRDPGRVAEGTLGLSEFRRRFGLFRASL